MTALSPFPPTRSNRSDLALVRYIHKCPRGEEVCIGGLAEQSDDEPQKSVALRECWLPENITTDTCTDDAISW